MEDFEYQPGEREESDEDVPEDWEAERSSKAKTKSTKKRTTLLIADAPVTLHQYQSTLKEKLVHLYGHREEQGDVILKSSSWQPITDDWVRVQDK